MTAPVPSIESLVVEALPTDDRELLRCGAVLRYITRPLAEVVTGSPEGADRLVEHPVVQGGAQGRVDELWTIAEPLRRALLVGWDGADGIRALVAADASAGLEARYARLAADATRAAALTELDGEFTRALADGDVPRAHDLLRLLDEWPVVDEVEARDLRDRLTPRLRRHSRALRDREATETYFERGFEQPVSTLLLDGDDRWMLHLHGPGGRGKTMFVKSLLGRRCPDRDIPVARIDFDHVSQLGTATTEPWRLLLSIAEQLDPQLPDAPFTFMLDSYGTLQDVTQPEALPRVPPVSAVVAGTRTNELAVEAAGEVPTKFRAHLARAVGDGHVVIALDTVENVLHADGADLVPVLATFSQIFHGVAGPDDSRVPGLRLVISGRYDITERDRAPGVQENWVGPAGDVARRTMGGTDVRLGREIATLRVPGFTRDEATSFLAGPGGVTDPDIVEAIVHRTHDNPMKLALLAEYVNRNPGITAATIASFESIDLFYLVDRVVDRIADGRVQWLLRWGALLPVLSREAVERVVWPALEAFAETGRGYDDAGRDGLPAPPENVSRWRIPEPAEVREPGALDRAWAALLDYTAHASWVDRVEGLPDAVAFHPEVREPLRRLLRRGGHPAYDDIHRRSYAYWCAAIESVQGVARAAALRAALFHAYQPWKGADHDGDRLFHDLLERARDRGERAAVAREVLEVTGPRDDVRSIAHLELAEAAIDDANRRGAPVPEAVLSRHLGQIGADIQSREPRRCEFIRAVLAVSSGRVDEGWTALGRALGHPRSASHLALMASWVDRRTPPSSALDTVRRLMVEAGGTPSAAPAARALTRGLLAAERWVDAIDAVSRAESGELRAAALVALGQADEVLDDGAHPGGWRAWARLLRYEPSAALRELDTGSTRHAPDDLAIRGNAYAQLDRWDEALDVLSQAASSSDTALAVEASLLMAHYMARLGRTEAAGSHLKRLRGFADPIVVLRATMLDAWVCRRDDNMRSEKRLAEAEGLAAETAGVRASNLVDLAVTRLVVRGITDTHLNDLADALESVQGAAARLIQLRALVYVANPTTRKRAAIGRRLARLTQLDDARPTTAVALVLARAELARVLGENDAALARLDQAAGRDDPDGAIARAVADIRGRILETSTLPGSEVLPTEPSDRIALRLSTDPADVSVRVAQDEAVRVLPADVLANGTYLLGQDPQQLLDQLGRALLPEPGPDSLDLYLSDPDVARWPWEVASIPGPPTLLRRQVDPPAATEDPPIPLSEVQVTILSERKDRGHVASLLTSLYGGRANVVPGFRSGMVHLVADPVQRNRFPALRQGDRDLLTAETLAQSLRGGPRLLVLDLVLSKSDYDAAEQLMIANAFCWHLVRSAPDVDVICGMFSAGDRVGSLTRLVELLHEGRPLAAIAGDLQRGHPTLPGGRPRWRDFVAVSTDHPNRRYRLEGPS